MRRTTSIAALFAAATLAVAPAAMAQEADWWSDWDANDDGVLSNEEFQAAYSDNEMFGQMDKNMDGMVTEDEARDATFVRLDVDQNGTLDQDEMGATEPTPSEG